MENSINVRFQVDQGNWEDIKANLIKAREFTEQGKVYEVHIHRKRRSNPQNDYFHTMLHDIANATGHSFEEVKDWVKAECLGTQAVQIRERTILRSRASSTLTEDEMSLLIQRTEVLHAELV
jgi:hypothetical protein